MTEQTRPWWLPAITVPERLNDLRDEPLAADWAKDFGPSDLDGSDRVS